MPRSIVGLLAALGAVLSAMMGFVHGDLAALVGLGAGLLTGGAAYLALPPFKKNPGSRYSSRDIQRPDWFRLARTNTRGGLGETHSATWCSTSGFNRCFNAA
jgi:hypothetical protein